MTGDTTREIALRLMSAELESAYDYLWVGPPSHEVRQTRALVRSLVGSLEVARAAGVGLVPPYKEAGRLLGRVNRGLAAADVHRRAHEEELRALGLAHVQKRSLMHSLGGRLAFPLHGAFHATGIAAMSLDGSTPRWRCHTAALGLPSPAALVFEAGLSDRDGFNITVCGDPASALRFRSTGITETNGFPPVGPVMAPPTRRLHPAQAQWIARHARGSVELLVDEENPKRAQQFTKVLEAEGLEVNNVLDQTRRAVEQLERHVAELKEESRRPRRGWVYDRAMSREGGAPR